jgi:hypothetical protein
MPLEKPMKTMLAAFLVAAAAALPLAAHAADAERTAEVARRGAEVMPFDLKATTHVFTKTRSGGIQRVVAKNPRDAQQIRLVREHLRKIRGDFLKGDFADPARIHGADMPGLQRLQAAKPGDVAIKYRDVPAGAELAYATRQPELVAALHQWFDAQLSDHGPDAMAGHHR